MTDFEIKAKIGTLSHRELDRCVALKERQSCYDQFIVDRTVPGCRLTGYWQTEKYFAHIRPQLLSELTLCEPVKEYIANLAQAVNRHPNSASVHFRRGDYVTDPQVASFHGVCNITYYQNAIRALKAARIKPHFFLFSDDPDWLAANVPDEIEDFTIVDSRQSSDREDLWLMSLCKHHIVANSSFSWWGAWLSQKQGLQFAPAQWFISPTFIDRDIVPPTWHRIPAVA
ncbi:alpha-1,2-fucosyltransferase [Aquabacterium sp. G14]|uniref:alpha-1,2-fucosyltransferase n=1 Tax=Aquabacterium sp. G14 TaxID=3130164 RepID=UPI0030A533A8